MGGNQFVSASLPLPLPPSLNTVKKCPQVRIKNEDNNSLYLVGLE